MQKHPIIFDVVTTNGLQAAQFRARIGWPAHVSRRKHDSVGARNFRRSGTGCYSTFCREKSGGARAGGELFCHREENRTTYCERNERRQVAPQLRIFLDETSFPGWSFQNTRSIVRCDATIQFFRRDKNYAILLEQDIVTDNETTTIRLRRNIVGNKWNNNSSWLLARIQFPGAVNRKCRDRDKKRFSLRVRDQWLAFYLAIGDTELRPIQHPAKVTPGRTFFSLGNLPCFLWSYFSFAFSSRPVNGTPRNRRLKPCLYCGSNKTLND